MSESTVDLLSDKIAVEPLGELVIRGRSNLVRVFKPIG